jgi:hypothetical protein
MKMLNFLAEEFHDIAPPLDYSLIPPWLVFVIVFVALSLLGLVVWLFGAPQTALASKVAARDRARRT